MEKNNRHTVKNQRKLTLLEMQNLMMETLAYEERDIDCNGSNFKMHYYEGTELDLYRLMEGLAIKRGLISKNVSLERGWGARGMVLHENIATNFSRENIRRLYEAFHSLLNKGIIAPGGDGNLGGSLPVFHVTEYGIRCIKQTEILPYDPDGYIEKLKNIEGLDKWVEFYIKEALQCFNAECLEASVIMMGLASELLCNNIITNFVKFLKLKIPEEEQLFSEKIKKAKTISQKYSLYLAMLDKLNKKRASELKKIKIEGLKELSVKLDVSAKENFLTYTRLNRNELAHPNRITKERIEVLMHLIGFVKYCELQYSFINYFKENSGDLTTQ
ncbi:MAG: hypothetical protein ACRCW0_01820 [Clostridium sp.]